MAAKKVGWKSFQIVVIGLFAVIGVWASIEQGSPGMIVGMLLFGILLAGGITYGISDFQDWRLERQAARRDGGEQHTNQHLRAGLKICERAHPVDSRLPSKQNIRQMPGRSL